MTRRDDVSVKKSVRAFLAVEFSEKTRNEIADLSKEIMINEMTRLISYNPKELHLTMKFLGDIRRFDIDQIVCKVSGIIQNCSPFEVGLGAVGVFPTLRNPRSFWIGMSGQIRPLYTLHKQIDRVMRTMGHERETRRFTPHITVARIPNRIPKSDIKTIAKGFLSLTIDMDVKIEINSISLMESSLEFGGRHYTTLAKMPFGLI